MMWKLVNQIKDPRVNRIICTSSYGVVVWQFKKILLIGDDFKCKWECKFDSVYEAREFNDKFIIFQKSNQGPVYILRIDNGELEKEISGEFFLSNSICLSNGYLLSSTDNNIDSWKLLSGKGEVSESHLPQDRIFTFASGNFIFSCVLSEVKCFDIRDGKECWSIDTSTLKRSTKERVDLPFSVVVLKGICVAIFTTHLAALDVLTGEILWENEIGARYLRILNGDTLILLGGLNYIYVIKIETGEILKYNTLVIKSESRGKGIPQNLMEDLYKSNFVQDDDCIYFCLRSSLRIVTVRKSDLKLVDVFHVSIDTPIEMFNWDIFLLEDRLYVKVFLSNEKYYSILVYQKENKKINAK